MGARIERRRHGVVLYNSADGDDGVSITLDLQQIGWRRNSQCVTREQQRFRYSSGSKKFYCPAMASKCSVSVRLRRESNIKMPFDTSGISMIIYIFVLKRYVFVNFIYMIHVLLFSNIPPCSHYRRSRPISSFIF